MNKEVNIKAATDVARMMNYKLHAECLSVPLLSGFNIEEVNDPQTIMLATGPGFVMQLTSDGFALEEDFDKRIELVIDSTKDFLKKANCENVDKSFIFYKDYNNGIFDFKIYVQDMVVNVKDEKKVVRSFNAYFIEPKMKDFYQFSLSAGPFTFPTEYLKVGIIDLENDNITITLDNLLKTLLDNLTYKK